MNGVTFVKVKAHVAKARAEAMGPAARRLWEANAAADKWAKEGARIGTNSMLEHVGQAVTDQAARVYGALDLIAGITEKVLGKREGWPDVTPVPAKRLRTRSPTRPTRHVRQHHWHQKAFGQQCETCLRVACTEAKRSSLDDAGCSGHAIGKLILDDIGWNVVINRHRLWKTGPFVWCSICGSYTSQRVRALGRTCRGGSRLVGGQASRRANLRAGKAPTAGPGAEILGQPERLSLATWLDWIGVQIFDGQGEAAELNNILEQQVALDSECTAY